LKPVNCFIISNRKGKSRAAFRVEIGYVLHTLLPASRGCYCPSLVVLLAFLFPEVRWV
jgi:hypothetical protein